MASLHRTPGLERAADASFGGAIFKEGVGQPPHITTPIKTMSDFNISSNPKDTSQGDSEPLAPTARCVLDRSAVRAVEAGSVSGSVRFRAGP